MYTAFIISGGLVHMYSHEDPKEAAIRAAVVSFKQHIPKCVKVTDAQLETEFARRIKLYKNATDHPSWLIDDEGTTIGVVV